MLKKNLSIFFYLLTITSFSQTSKIDSLKIELVKKPLDFYTQKNLIGEYVGLGDIENLKKEIIIAKKRFKNNVDYFNYFKINDIFILLIQQENNLAKKAVINYESTINFKNVPNTKILINYFGGVIDHRLGKNKSSENYLKNCFKIIKENKFEKKRFINIYIYYGNALLRIGDYENALKTFFETIKFTPKNEKFNIYSNIGICYYNLKQLDKAEKYYKLGVDYADEKNKPNCSSNLAILYLEKNNYLKAQETLKNLDFNKFTSTDSSAVFNVLGEIEQRKKNYKKALSYYNIVVSIDKRENKSVYLANDYAAIGALYIELKNYKIAEDYLNQSYDLLKNFDDKNAEKQVLESLLITEFAHSKNEKYQNYFLEYLAICDTLNSDVVLESTNLLEKKYQTAGKESKIKTQQLQIQKEKANRNIALSGVALLVVLAGGGLWFFKNKQKTTALQTQNTLLGLQQNLIEAELYSLNKQLDPHEIKNLLASIAPEIQEKAPESYKKMLKLLHLTKASLNSNSITDTIENQLQQIDDFLSLEKSMLSIPLEYSIENNIQNKQTQIPQLLLKNLVENAIKHGIKPQEKGGNISVKVDENDNFIYITVDDTGIGRQHAISLDSGIGTTTYQKLFVTLNPKNKENATFEIIDKEQGTKVEVKIPIDYKYL